MPRPDIAGFPKQGPRCGGACSHPQPECEFVFGKENNFGLHYEALRGKSQPGRRDAFRRACTICLPQVPEAQNIGVHVPQIRRRPVLLNSSCICWVTHLTKFVPALQPMSRRHRPCNFGNSSTLPRIELPAANIKQLYSVFCGECGAGTRLCCLFDPQKVHAILLLPPPQPVLLLLLLLVLMLLCLPPPPDFCAFCKLIESTFNDIYRPFPCQQAFDINKQMSKSKTKFDIKHNY